MLLHQGSEYRIKEGYVEIIGGIRLKIIGWDKRYDGYENREARLVYKDGRMILWISKKIPRLRPYNPRGAVAVDVNERKIVYRDDKISKEMGTAMVGLINGGSLWKICRDGIPQQGTAWRRRDILNMIISYYWKAENVLRD